MISAAEQRKCLTMRRNLDLFRPMLPELLRTLGAVRELLDRLPPLVVEVPEGGDELWEETNEKAILALYDRLQKDERIETVGGFAGILDALESRDPVAMRAAMATHIRGAQERIVQAMMPTPEYDAKWMAPD